MPEVPGSNPSHLFLFSYFSMKSSNFKNPKKVKTLLVWHSAKSTLKRCLNRRINFFHHTGNCLTYWKCHPQWANFVGYEEQRDNKHNDGGNANALDGRWKNHQKLIEEYEKWMEHCHIERWSVTYRSQLFHEVLLLIRVVNMSALDHKTSTYDMLAVRCKIHIFCVLVSSWQICLKISKEIC